MLNKRDLKILHIIPNLHKGGAERLVLDICNTLKKREDCEVKLITFRDDNSYTFLTENIDWNVIPSFVQLSITGKTKVSISDLQKAIDAYKPDIIHTHLFEAELVSRFCSYPRARWFTHIHDNMLQFNKIYFSSISKYAITNFFEKYVLFKRYKKNRGTHFIAISKHTESYIKSVQSKYPVTLLHNAIEVNRFKKPVYIDPKSYNLSKDLGHKSDNIGSLQRSINLINIGSFVPKKNQTFLLDVIIELNKKGVQVNCLFLGDGILKKEVEQRANKLEIINQCQFLGNIENVEEYLWNSDIYLHSALHEPFGLAIVEAMAAGLPVITLDGGGNRDLIIEGKNGYLMEDINPVTFAERIADLWANKEKMKEMGEFAQQFAQQFSIDSYCDKLLEIYKNA